MADAILIGSPYSYFPNGYPLLIVLLKYLFSNSLIPIVLIIFNILLQVATLILLERILNIYKVENNLKLLALLIIAIYPNQINYTRQILTEPASLFLLTLSVYLYSYKKLYLSGFIGYLTSQFRPTLLPFIPIVVLYHLFKKNYYKSLKISIGFISCLILFILLTNYSIIKPPSNLGLNLLISIQSDSHNIKFSPTDFTVDEIENPVRTYTNFIINNPIKYLEQRFISLWVLWGPLPVTHRGTIEQILLAIRFPLIIFSVLAFIFYKRIGITKELLLLLSTPIVIITITHTLFFSQQRFTFVVEPFTIILSVLFLNYFFIKVKRLF